MTEKIERILNDLKTLKIPISKIESDLGFSNGLLGKAKKGESNLSEEKFNILQIYHKNAIAQTDLEVKEQKETNGHEHKDVLIEGYELPKIQPPADKIKTLRLSIEKIDKDFGKGSVQFIGDKPQQNIQVIPTGSLSLNAALGVGGFPKGRIIEIYGQESSGKTTIALQVIAQAQKMGEVCAFIDAEHSFDNDYAKGLGIDIDNLLVSQPDHGEQALEIADRLIITGAVGVIVIDSVAALVPKSELEGEMGDSKMGLHARLMSQACRKMTGSISKTNCVCIFINQMRDVIGAMPYAPQHTTTGGKALKFYASVRLDVAKIGQIKDGDLTIGNRVKIKVAKNKVAPPFKIAEFDLYFGKGIDTVGEIIDIASEKNIIQKSGSWYSYNGSKIGQGKEQVKQLLNDNTELLKEIRNKI